jgi:CRISPR-associated protein Cas2
MEAPGWYVVAYDIRDARRLRAVHRVLRAEAIPVQRSVFLAFGTVAALERLLSQLDTLIDVRVDDLRAYPVDEPPTLWLSGSRALDGGLLRDAALLGDVSAASDDGHWRRLFVRMPTAIGGPTPT